MFGGYNSSVFQQNYAEVQFGGPRATLGARSERIGDPNPARDNNYGSWVDSAGDANGDGADELLVSDYRLKIAYAYYGEPPELPIETGATGHTGSPTDPTSPTDTAPLDDTAPVDDIGDPVTSPGEKNGCGCTNTPFPPTVLGTLLLGFLCVRTRR